MTSRNKNKPALRFKGFGSLKKNRVVTKNAPTEDFLLGQMMDTEKTGTTVSRAKIISKLKTK